VERTGPHSVASHFLIVVTGSFVGPLVFKAKSFDGFSLCEAEHVYSYSSTALCCTYLLCWHQCKLRRQEQTSYMDRLYDRLCVEPKLLVDDGQKILAQSR